MDSKVKTPGMMLVVLAVALSGGAFYLSDGLNPSWWAIWLAPLPILWIAPQISWRGTGVAALAAQVMGELSSWNYHRILGLPLWLRLELLLVPAIVFVLAVLLFRAFFRRRKVWLAVTAFPVVIVSYEYLTSLAFGTFGDTAYMQLRNLPVLQLGALAGPWGIGFVVMLFPAMIAALILSQADSRRPLVIALAIVFGCVFAYGGYRLYATPPAPNSIVVGLADSDLKKNLLPQDDPSAMRLMRDYGEQVKELAQSGAQVIVLPEMTAIVRDSISRDVDTLFEEAARSANVQIVLGVLHVTGNAAFNEARLYSATGELETVYRKHHLVPVVEGSTTPGTDISVLPQPIGKVGLEICRDMDYPNPARRYGRKDVGLLLVPAWDFDVDRLWHGHMAILRGVEDGFTIVRAAKQGFLTVSDDRGRVLAEARTTPQEPFTTLVAQVPVRHDPTLYQRWGDWFAWVNVAALAGLCVSLAAGGRARQEAARAADAVS